MKRHNNIYRQLCSMHNLRKAELTARKGKANQYGVIVFDKNKEANLLKLHEMLVNKTYRTSAYRIFKIKDPKEREVYALPYFPDRIVHHLVMIPLEKILKGLFTADTYACIKGKGITPASMDLRTSLKDTAGTLYCLKLDVKQFYRSIDHDILKQMFLRKFKDRDFLNMIFEIIDSAPGVPIGNLLSQSFANLYLTPFDHWIKETMKVKHYFRYMDDIVILASDKEQLHRLLSQIREYWHTKLKLIIKENYQVFPVAARGIDFVGYVHYHNGLTLIRPGIKKRFIRMMSHNRRKASIASYCGWFKHGNCINLQKKYLHGNKSTIKVV